jgi:uncharacterized protein (DUF58 family)
MPIADSIILEQRSTYILPTKAGLLMLAVIGLMMVGATNYQNNLAFMLTFLIIGIGLVSTIFTFRNLQGLAIKRGAIESVCAGQVLSVNAHFSSQSANEHLTIGCGFDKFSLCYSDVLSLNGTTFQLPLVAKSRGWLSLPRMMATSSFPFGLLKVWTWFKFETPVLVYPKPIEPPPEGGTGNTDEENGDSKTLGSDDLYGLKSYQPGEPISRIDWKALAREKGLFSKEFVSYQSNELLFDWDSFAATEQELRLSYLTYLVIHASHQNLEFSLKIPGKLLPTSSGEYHQKQCLEALALFRLQEKQI